MKPRNGALAALFLLATCNEESPQPSSANVESAKQALGTIAASEVATWQQVGGSLIPAARYLQAAAFDDARKVFVMFGGQVWSNVYGTPSPSQEIWEWSPATGKWSNRASAGTMPDARSGAAMTFDSQRKKFILFGGRAGSGYDYEDTWEWDPATGVWTDLTGAGNHPSARSQHAMVYEKSTGKILLFGGGRSGSNSGDPAGITVSLGDTWELDPVAQTWTAVQVSAGPTARHDLGMVWDGTRNKAVLFGGMQMDIAGATGIPKQDTWEWDAAASTWSERTALGKKPSARYAHAMAFDGSRGKAVVVGGWDITSGGSLADMWDWDPTSGAWTQRLTGSENNLPSARMYASLVSDDSRSRLELVAGEAAYSPSGYYGSGGSTGIYMPGPLPPGYPSQGNASTAEVWELEPVAPAFTDRTVPLDLPSPRMDQAMAYNPSTGLVYVFGGSDSSGQTFNDLWSWDGKSWAQVNASTPPPPRSGAGMAYDPARKSLIMFGGSANYGQTFYNDTWEWTPSGGWKQLMPTSSPSAILHHGMVTDTTRNKILLFGGETANYYPVMPIPYYPDAGIGIGSSTPNMVWEWDGGQMTWTNRTPIVSGNTPTPRAYPPLAYDEGRKKLFYYDTTSMVMDSSKTPAIFWEWDPVSAGWSERTTTDSLTYTYQIYAAYDSVRRREVFLTDAIDNTTGQNQTWEVESGAPTWYVRALPNTPSQRSGSSMVFDSGRGVVVVFGGAPSNGSGPSTETWEYKVTALGNGEGCTAAFASSCASGNCVDGVCCESASCTGPCKSCDVAGSEGKCVLAMAGTEVPGSCSNGQACDSTGACKSRNGQACTGASTCASGYCTDGVCCDSACTGTCVSCNQAGRQGQCTPYTAGTDPQGECQGGSDLCKSTCDGVGACVFPAYGSPCASCMACDGMGTCDAYDYTCGFAGTGGNGYGGYPYNTGGYPYNTTGYPYNLGGYPYNTGSSRPNTGGYPFNYSFGGYPYDTGGSHPNTGGSPYNFGGYPTNAGGNPYNTGGAPYNFGGTQSNYGGAGGGLSSGGGGRTGAGGSGGGDTHRDGGVSDAITIAQLHRTGCSCDVGQGQGSGLGLGFLILGTALLLGRARRRRS